MYILSTSKYNYFFRPKKSLSKHRTECLIRFCVRFFQALYCFLTFVFLSMRLFSKTVVAIFGVRIMYLLSTRKNYCFQLKKKPIAHKMEYLMYDFMVYIDCFCFSCQSFCLFYKMLIFSVDILSLAKVWDYLQRCQRLPHLMDSCLRHPHLFSQAIEDGLLWCDSLEVMFKKTPRIFSTKNPTPFLL